MKLPSSGAIIRACLVILPVGIIVIGAACLFYTTVVKPESVTANPSLPVWDESGTPVSAIRKTSLIDHLSNLSERIGERHAGKIEQLNAARFYIQSTLGVSNLGYEIEEDEYRIEDQVFVNVVAELPGTKWPEQIVVVGAHYDTIPGTPGADDNSSGVASLLALAEAFARKPQARTLRFVAFTNEEPPFFQTPDMGSHRYAKACSLRGDQIVAMLSLESIGYYSDEPNSQHYPPVIGAQYPTVGNFMAVVGNQTSRLLVDMAHASAAGTRAIPVEKGAFPAILPGVGWSDQSSFWQFDYPAVMFTGTATYRNPHYHLPTDTVGTLDFDRLAAATTAIRQAILDLANQPDLPWIAQKNS